MSTSAWNILSLSLSSVYFISSLSHFPLCLLFFSLISALIISFVVPLSLFCIHLSLICINPSLSVLSLNFQSSSLCICICILFSLFLYLPYSVYVYPYLSILFYSLSLVCQFNLCLTDFLHRCRVSLKSSLVFHFHFKTFEKRTTRGVCVF